jgi:hypothetical protein
VPRADVAQQRANVRNRAANPLETTAPVGGLISGAVGGAFNPINPITPEPIPPVGVNPPLAPPPGRNPRPLPPLSEPDKGYPEPVRGGTSPIGEITPFGPMPPSTKPYGRSRQPRSPAGGMTTNPVAPPLPSAFLGRAASALGTLGGPAGTVGAIAKPTGQWGAGRKKFPGQFTPTVNPGLISGLSGMFGR